MKYKILCRGCGNFENRNYLPQWIKCHKCGEAYEVDEYEEIKD